MEEEFFPDLEKMCRLCLCIRNEEELVGIFSQNGNNADIGKGTIQMSIPMRIMACAALEVQVGDGLPKAICNECRYQLEKFYYFRKRSQLSDSKLRKHIRLLNLGKKSKVFQKNEDDDGFEEELEFEDSIIFIQKREDEMKAEANALCEQRLKNDFDQQIVHLKSEWMEQYKAELKDEVANELRSSVVAEVKQELRAEMEEEIKVALRQECTEQAKEELRTEVMEECRVKERISLLDDLQVFLNQKKSDTVATKLNSAVVHTAIDSLEAQSSDMPEAADEAVRVELPSTSSSHEIIENEEICAESQAESDVENVENEPEFYLIEPMSNPDEEENEVVTTKSQRKRKSVEHSQRFEYFEDKLGTANFRLTASESSNQEPGSDTYHNTGQVQQYNYKDGQVLEKIDNEDIIVFNLADDFEDEQAEHLAQIKKPYAEKDSKLDEKVLFTKNIPEESFASNNDGSLLVHMRKTNTPKTFKCDSCPMLFSTKNSMERHNRTHAKVEERGGLTHECKVCNVHLSCKSALKRHMIIHSGEKPHSCEHCGKAFVQREVLKRHMLTHTGAKPHKCNICGRTFTHKYSLINHVQRTHSDVPVQQQHICHLCPKRFNHMSGLSRHLVTHTGLTFQCVECKRKFADRSSVRRHITNVHDGGKNSSADSSIKIQDIEFYSVDDDAIIVANEENSSEYLV
ncbi:zinc finger protein 892-like isoform X2 [Eurosta solidaginis]|uniref:zinc finger protein 892-like isoform X2 n=1 Tax=Eurosta solidaginis TaxID=178769 RepID=UPI00353120C3